MVVVFRKPPVMHRKLSYMSEKGEIKRDGAKAQKNSGRNLNKGDSIWFGCVVDYKESTRSFGITRKVWAKICTDAFTVDRNKQPVLKLILGEGNEKVRLAVVEWGFLEELLNERQTSK